MPLNAKYLAPLHMDINQLTSCDTEPIHIPGKIQGHGFLLATDKNFNITHCSANIQDFISMEASSLLGKSVNALSGITDFGGNPFDLANMTMMMARQQRDLEKIGFDVLVKGTTFNVSVQFTERAYLFDFEPELSDLATNIQGIIGRSLSEMLSDRDFVSLVGNAATQVRQIIGYDRVMVYKFHEDGHGEVVAESKDDELESWMGLHYPASDIPVQARELYKLNLVRLIADVHREPQAILTLPQFTAPLDLTHSGLRAVSPVHIRYLINMGVASSFSISILEKNNLWGLIACHNYTPRYINTNQRESAKLVGQVLSSAISFREQDQDQKAAAQHNRAIEGITRNLLRDISIEDALAGDLEFNLKNIVECTGAGLFFENNLRLVGKAPDEKFLHELIEWLGEQTKATGIYHTNKLSTDYPNAASHKELISGLLAIRLGKDLNEYLLWFRPETMTTVKWAGRPEKEQELDENGLIRISPRNSFAEWTEQVKLTSENWRKDEIKAATSLKEEVNYAVARRARELKVINDKLRLAYEELDTFSYTISHDLKGPITTIKSYAELMAREGVSVEKIKLMAEKIKAGTKRMQVMIDEILQYARVGQSRLKSKTINMQRLLEELRQDLLISSVNPSLNIQLSGTPDIVGDEILIFQVFSNIIGNAVKYSAKNESPLVVIEGRIHEQETIYSISDNGIGIPTDQHQSIFELFSRATTSREFEGTGVGLAIVKRILEKHDGRIWLQSDTGNGSTFNLAFKNLPVLTTLN